MQEAFAGRQHLCDAEGSSRGWSGAEVLFMQRACSEGFPAGGRGRHQELEQGRGQTAGPCRGAFHAGGRFLEGLLHEAVKGVQDRAEAGCRPEALRTAGEAARRRGAGEAAV